MTPAEINRAIAESVGWKFIPCHDDRFGRATGERWLDPDGDTAFDCPNYHGDLNAIQGAVNALPDRVRDSLRWEMVNILTVAHGDKPITPIDYITATANMWATAYVRAIGKWRDQ
jgi:hypothetical protein